MPERFAVWQAVAWTVAATAGLSCALTLVVIGFGRRVDIVPLGLAQVGVYGAASILFASWQKRPLRELLALRVVPFRSCLVAAALGVVLQFPSTLLANVIERFFPVPDSVLAHRLALITPHSIAHGVAIVLIVSLVGPCVEEFFFRGVLFGALRRGHSALLTMAVVSFCFVVAHMDLRLLLPLLPAAWVMAEVREHSGSIWPGLALHSGFNSLTLLGVFSGLSPTGKAPPVPPLLAFLACLCAAALFRLIRLIAAERRP
ncbi:MAG TPA: CPBP family intramembrane glutamic endopeptidase [Polyangiaceae bacterium]|nr:CPBP family intramembrane glutamic endopeptidase [Polyangiaceae bacterium]